MKIFYSYIFRQISNSIIGPPSGFQLCKGTVNIKNRLMFQSVSWLTLLYIGMTARRRFV